MRDTLDQLIGQMEAHIAQATSMRETLTRLDAMVPRITRVVVEPGQDIQAAFSSLFATGGILDLQPGAHDALTLPYRQNPALIAIQGEGATLRGFFSRNGQNVSFEDVGFVNPVNRYGHVMLGGTRTEVARPEDVPSGFSFHRCPFTGPARRAIAANCADLIVEDCAIRDYYELGADSQAITGWNGSRNHLIRRNLLMAASENIQYGGSDAASEAMMPQGIVIEDNVLTKLDAWYALNVNIKDLFELKNARDVQFRRNTLTNIRRAAWPQGVAIIINTANQENSNPWARVENVTIEENAIDDVGMYLQIVGRNAGPYTSGISRNILVRRNRFGRMHLEGTGHAVQIQDGPEGVVIDHNDFLENRHSFLECGGTPGTLVQFTNNVARHGIYGYNVNANAAPPYVADIRGNALEVRSGTQPQDKFPLESLNVYYPAPIASATFSAHVTTDGLPVGA